MKPRSDLTKILEFWRWPELSRTELLDLADVAVDRAWLYDARNLSWGHKMALQWFVTANDLRIASAARITPS